VIDQSRVTFFYNDVLLTLEGIKWILVSLDREIPMNKATEKLSRIFKLEAKQGFENRAVMGGMVRLTQAWESDFVIVGWS